MNARRACRVVFRLVAPCLVAFAVTSGCQSTMPPAQALIEVREKVDGEGLTIAREVSPVKASVSVPPGWRTLKLQKTAIYTHQQWRSPTRRTAVGVTYIRMPLPFSAKTLAWLASARWAKAPRRGPPPRTDPAPRMVRGGERQVPRHRLLHDPRQDAWINYSGWRVKEPREAGESSWPTAPSPAHPPRHRRAAEAAPAQAQAAAAVGSFPGRRCDNAV